MLATTTVPCFDDPITPVAEQEGKVIVMLNTHLLDSISLLDMCNLMCIGIECRELDTVLHIRHGGTVPWCDVEGTPRPADHDRRRDSIAAVKIYESSLIGASSALQQPAIRGVAANALKLC